LQLQLLLLLTVGGPEAAIHSTVEDVSAEPEVDVPAGQITYRSRGMGPQQASITENNPQTAVHFDVQLPQRRAETATCRRFLTSAQTVAPHSSHRYNNREPDLFSIAFSTSQRTMCVHVM
jgi:hypothetical protein